MCLYKAGIETTTARRASTMSQVRTCRVLLLLAGAGMWPPTVRDAAAGHLQALLETPGVEQADLSSMQLLMYGASPIGDVLLNHALKVLRCRFMQAYADAQSEHRVLTEDVKFLDERARGAVLEGQRQVVTAFAQGIAACRPDLRAELHKPMAMLLFGMINWTFTWLRPDGVLTYADLGDIVADLFFGGLPAVTAGPPIVRSPSLASSQAKPPQAGLR
jgi:hypothetical protein